MSKFVTDKLREFDIGDGEWVKIPVALSYSTVTRIQAAGNEEAVSKAILIECIKEWNIKDDEGNIPPVNTENIEKLDVRVITMISEELYPLIINDQDKKK